MKRNIYMALRNLSQRYSRQPKIAYEEKGAIPLPENSCRKILFVYIIRVRRLVRAPLFVYKEYGIFWLQWRIFFDFVCEKRSVFACARPRVRARVGTPSSDQGF